jgi:hypothetical protein
MAVLMRRNLGMLLLGIWLVLYGLVGFIPLGFSGAAMSALAFVAGVFILAGR